MFRVSHKNNFLIIINLIQELRNKNYKKKEFKIKLNKRLKNLYKNNKLII